MKLTINKQVIENINRFVKARIILLLILALSTISIISFIYYLLNGLGVAYNDARSHLDIARRVVENLKPGFAQLGSVWLPLPHILMLLTVWNDFMWHSGLSGSLPSMISYVATGILIYLFLRELKVGLFGRVFGVMFFALNSNIVYMQSTAMTELLLLCTMTAAAYELLIWHRDQSLFRLLRIAFWVMLATLIRYDGWFLFIFVAAVLILHTFRKYGFKRTEGTLLLFGTLAGFGIFLWLLWNLMIFKDPLYFAFGPYSASNQQDVLAAAGALPTKHNWEISIKSYLYALSYNINPFFLIFAAIGGLVLWFDKKLSGATRVATAVLMAPFFFNILALYLGHSSLFVKDINASWFNVRYGLMMVPSLAIFAGYLVGKVKYMRYMFLGLFLFITFFIYNSHDAVSLDDALVGASGKNVKEVSGWLKDNAGDKDGFVLISVASHDAIIFSSGLDMSRFIHEGTGRYWSYATTHPTNWARWIIMRTGDKSDGVYGLLQDNDELKNYRLVHKYPFADIYELKPQYLSVLETKPVLKQVK
jgi:hypothetical protein